MTKEWRLLFLPECDMLDTVALGGPAVELQKNGPMGMSIVGFKETGVSLGFFQDIDTEVDLEKCKEHGVRVIRRLGVGGGTIFVDKNASMAVGLLYYDNFFPDMDTAFQKFGKVIVEAYKKLGVKEPWYKHIGDVKVGERKITGFGFAQVFEIILGNTILSIGEPDMDLFSKVAKIPPEKFLDKKAKSVSEWVTSVEAETGRVPSKEEVRDAFVEAFEQEIGVKLAEGEMTEEEEKIRQKWRAMASSPEHTFKVSSKKRFSKVGGDQELLFSRYKGRKLIVTHLLLNSSGKIDDIMFSGDFYARPDAYLWDMEKSLIGLDATDEGKLLEKIKETYRKPGWEIPMVEPEDFLKGISIAVKEQK
ncbi:MAG: biotin/lipoate A/B protein ligase family protein [Candidatus Jordarchaeaceae archaeon]